MSVRTEPPATQDFPTPESDRAPSWQTPTGPVWIVERKGDHRPWLVRRLTGAPGLLKLGVTLRYSCAASHPRLHSPTAWWRDRDQTWIAGPHCEGPPLAIERPERPTWSQAVDAISPLAVALRGAHRRGVVHGHLAPWNVFFDATTRRLSAVDFGTWPVESLSAGPFVAPELVQAQQTPQPTPGSDIHNLARLLIFLAISPKEARRDRPNFETLPAYAIATLERSLKADPAQRPQTIDDFLAGLSFEKISHPVARSPAEKKSVSGRARDLEIFEHPRNGRGLRFYLDGADGEGSTGFFVYHQQHPKLFDSLRHLWDGAELNLDAPRTVEDSAGNRFLSATSDTIPVIEPHWPVSVSNVLKAQGCPQRVMVDMRDPGERSYHLAFGNLVHGFLEDLTSNEKLSFEQVVEERVPDLHLDFLAAGVDDSHLAKLIQQARDHFEHLRRFTTRRNASAPQHDRIGWCGEHAEATRYSARYGLEGRTDLVVTDPDEGLQIIELKSGKPWHDHAGQVQSYALLWQQLAARNELATTGHLLYSKTGRMKEVPLHGDGARHNLLHGRNGLLTLHHSLVDRNADYRPPTYMEQPKLCRQNACRFRRDRCRAQTELLGLGDGNGDESAPTDTSGLEPDLMRRARRYHRHMSRLIEMERWTDHRDLGAIFQPHQLPQRVADGKAAAELTLKPAGDSPTSARALLCGEGLHVFSPSDRILIHRGDVDAHHVLRARVVTRHDDDELEIRLRAADVGDEFVGPGWIADVMPTRIGYRTAHRALYRLLESRRADLLDALLRPHQQSSPEPEPAPSAELHFATQSLLNDSQIAAVQRGLSNRPATLVQGPPGTGKTTVIAHLCAELTMGEQQTVLLSALTNTAVDTMLVQLLDASTERGHDPPPFLRLGSSARSPLLADEMRRRGFDPTHYFSDDVAQQAPSLADLARRLDTTPVIATTAHSALRHPAITYYERHRDRPAFDVALIDEASQLTEPMALAPISTARRFVLVGDHRQLPPIVSAERALSAFATSESGFPIAQSLQNAHVAGLDRSLFERLATFASPTMLTTQYRMHRDIMAFPASSFYDDRLKAHASVADRTLKLDSPELPAILRAKNPVVFVDVDGREVGRSNAAEARALLDTAQHLFEAAEAPTVGVLSPFRAQVHLLRRLSRQRDLSTGLDIDTVERFQGNERDVILASLVKTDHPGDFLADVRRLNVALTRAKKKLIIFGCRSCLEQDATFRQWLSSPWTDAVSWTSTD